MEKERKLIQKRPMNLLFSLTVKDFEFQYFCVGGNGGQHVNRAKVGVRCIHPASGAVAEHRDGRDQFRNKQEAFRKCAETPEFKAWHKMEVARRTGALAEVEKLVDAAMNERNLKVEYFK